MTLPSTEGTVPPATVDVPVEDLFPEVRRLKAVGALLFVIAGLSAAMPALTLGEGLLAVRSLAALAVASAGVATGIAGLVSTALRRWSLLAAPVLLVAGAALASPGASMGIIPPEELLWALVFGASWLFALEHLHAVGRFVELGAYVTRQRLTSFQLANVVNHFHIYGVGLIALIMGITAIITVGVPWVFAKGTSDTFSRSVELSSVIGIGLASAVVFTLAGLILISVRSVLPQRVEVTSVAYSRERMEDMLRGSRVLARVGEEEVTGRGEEEEGR